MVVTSSMVRTAWVASSATSEVGTPVGRGAVLVDQLEPASVVTLVAMRDALHPRSHHDVADGSEISGKLKPGSPSSVAWVAWVLFRMAVTDC